MIIPKKQPGFALSIAILIVVILIIAGGAGYYFYKTSQEQKEAEVAKPEQVVDETADWKVYENKKYGFILKFPEFWADFEIHEWKVEQDLGRMPPYYDTIEFKIDRTQDNGKEYYFSIRIYPYSHDNWAARRLGQQTKKYSFISASHLPYLYLGENKDYVFSWGTSRGILSPEELGEDLAEDILQLRLLEAESIISTFKIINPIQKPAEWKDYFNPEKCKAFGEGDYTDECYLESLRAITEVELCKKIRPDYQDFCYFQVAQNLKNFSICENLSTLINQEACYQNIALSSKNASICKNIPTERWRNTCYGDIAELLKDPSICEEIANVKARGYCLKGANPSRPELPIPPISEWKTYVNEKHKYSFQYPPNWDFTVKMTNPETSELYVIRERISNEPEWPSEYEWLWNVVIEVWDNPQNLSLEDWLAVIKGVPADASRTANTFVGEEKVEALQLWQGGVGTTWDSPGRCFNDCPNVNVYFVYRDKGYRAALVYNRDDVDREGSEKIFSQILSTFKFEDKIVQISVSVDMGSFDLVNKTFEGWIRTGERRKVKIITTDSTVFYRTSEPNWEKEYFTFSELYSNTSPTWPLTVKGIFEEENIIKANEVFIIVQ